MVRGGQAGVRDGGACRRPHDALCQKEVAEETGNQQILHCIDYTFSIIAASIVMEGLASFADSASVFCAPDRLARHTLESLQSDSWAVSVAVMHEVHASKAISH